MGLKIFLSFIFVIFCIGILIVYWFIPFGTIEFGSKSSNFDLDVNQSGNMQFYQNMRYSDSKISYKIYDCPLQKKNDMEEAFNIISDLSILNFYLVNSNEEISVTCDSKNKIEDGLFVAGEGGPVYITKVDKFHVILKGKVLLIKESNCENPNIALHELLHALGFDHSENPDNIMYYISKCKQTIGQDQIDLINKLYSTPSQPDLTLENVSAVMRGKYLDVNMSIRNDGLRDSMESKILIYADDELVKEIKLDALRIGYGRIISFSNLWIKQINVNKLDFFIDYSFPELEKNNNRISLEVD
ncbi:matrixin family metalloprotease [Candidatus Pacearchaeota archaeon]|nr:matrixin family metalloprotease [Candidatus Pacearchaeota archaeon]